MSPTKATIFDDPNDPSDDGDAYWMATSDDRRIRVACWKPEAARGTILIFPGRTEYIERYRSAANDFSRRGYASLAIDWRGQGLSERLIEDTRIGHVEQFTDYQKDVGVMECAKQVLNMPRPYYLLAFSMGATIGLRALLEGLDVRAAIFCSPMWGIQMSPISRLATWPLIRINRLIGSRHHLTPTTGVVASPLANPFENNVLTTDQEMYSSMRNQLSTHPELAVGGPSLNWLFEALTETRFLAKQASPNMPCLTWLGSDDRVVGHKQVYCRMTDWPSGELKIFNGKRHHLLMHGTSFRAGLFDSAASFFSRNL